MLPPLQVKIDPRFAGGLDAPRLPPRLFLLRLLSNLRHTYLASNQVEEALAIIRCSPSHV